MGAEDNNAQSIKRRKIEEIGAFFEEIHFPPIVGRVFALLLLADPPHQTFYAIQEELAASKSSISDALNFLMKLGIVDFITFPGDRKRYFRVDAEGCLEDVKHKMYRTTAIQSILADVLKHRNPDKHREFNEGLAKLLEFHAFLGGEMSRIIAKWEAFKRNQEEEGPASSFSK